MNFKKKFNPLLDITKQDLRTIAANKGRSYTATDGDKKLLGPRVPGYISKEDQYRLLEFFKEFEQSSEYKNATDPQAIALVAFEEWCKKNP